MLGEPVDRAHPVATYVKERTVEEWDTSRTIQAESFAVSFMNAQ